jgi:hypothetical protein
LTSSPPPVSAHAVIRYLQRIHGLDLGPIVRRLGRNAGNGVLAEAAAETIGTTVEAVKRAICPPHLEGAVAAGAARIRREGFVLMIRAGMVVTIVEDLQHHKAKILTRRESKRGANRIRRRRG